MVVPGGSSHNWSDLNMHEPAKRSCHTMPTLAATARVWKLGGSFRRASEKASSRGFEGLQAILH